MQIQVLRSPELMAPIIKEIATRYPDVNYTSLLADLSINRFQETKILDIRYQDSDPQKIQYILQQLTAVLAIFWLRLSDAVDEGGQDSEKRAREGREEPTPFHMHRPCRL